MKCDNCGQNKKRKWFADYQNYLCEECFNELEAEHAEKLNRN
jgi:hypothetical protein